MRGEKKSPFPVVEFDDLCGRLYLDTLSKCNERDSSPQNLKYQYWVSYPFNLGRHI